MILLRKILILPLKIFVLLCVVGFALYHLLLIDIPDVRLLRNYNPGHSSYMNTDSRWFTFNHPTVEKFIPYDKIPKSVIRAVLVAEDDTFFLHEGFNWKALEKSFKLNLKRKKFIRGGSTITQQLARNLFLTRDKTILRKIKEAILTYKLEHALSKERILELYLNYAEFGPGIYGLSAASDYHFGSAPTNLSNAQAALLAAVLPNPKFYGHKPYPRVTQWRQKNILARLGHYDPLQPPKKKKDDNKVKTEPLQKTPQPVPLTKEELDQTDELTDDQDDESQFLDE